MRAWQKDFLIAQDDVKAATFPSQKKSIVVALLVSEVRVSQHILELGSDSATGQRATMSSGSPCCGSILASEKARAITVEERGAPCFLKSHWHGAPQLRGWMKHERHKHGTARRNIIQEHYSGTGRSRNLDLQKKSAQGVKLQSVAAVKHALCRLQNRNDERDYAVCGSVRRSRDENP
jgi:hypothetical protein